tara:strand:- start:415 stop:780 length:366 start_codon:yes stop_codon:yes gene_type:complete
MELVNERIKEHLIQIENLTKIKQQQNEKDSQMDQNIDKIKNEMENYNLFKFLEKKCIGEPCNCNNEQRKMYKQLGENRRLINNRRNALTGPDICKSDYELLLSKVIIDMYEEIQTLKKNSI